LLLQRDARERNYFFENALERNKGNRNFPAAEDLNDIFMGALLPTFSITRAYDGSSSQRAALRHFTGILIGRYINAVTLADQRDHARAVIEPDLRAEVTMLKELIWTYVIEAPSLSARQYGQQRIIRDLFSIYTELARKSKTWQVFPNFYRERLKEAQGQLEEVVRTCVDLIASMTESQAIAMHRRLTGQDHTAGLDDILQ
jgi:dGTPase